jgi:hypothetical protein
MTRVEARFRLAKPLDDNAMAGISKAHSVYGILRIKPVNNEELMVEYDATRLRPGEVKRVLAEAGVWADPE